MSDEKERAEQWHVFGASVTGAAHVLKKMPNQDAIYWKSGDGFPFALALADGHGSEKYFRSGTGARYASEIAVAELEEFAQAFNEPISNVPLFQHLVKQLPARITDKWRAKIAEDLQAAHFFTDEEWQRFDNGRALPETPRDPLLSYGSTLLTVLVTPFFILYLQLGDGDIVLVDEAAQVSKPMPDDGRLLANETTSLCSPTAVQDFRVHCDYLHGPPPALILLSSDGYANSFTNEQGFLSVGSDILEILHTEGLASVQDSLNEWLTTATEKGSGDDISLGIFYRETPALPLDKEPPTPEPAGAKITGPLEPVSETLLTAQDDQEAPSDALKVEAEEELPVLVVSHQAGKDTYSSIGEALKQAVAHARIEVGPGTYHECITIDKDVELVGIGEPGSIIITGPSPCLSIQADRAILQNLTICAQKARFTILPSTSAAVDITSGSSLLEGCQVSGGRTGVRVSGTAAEPVLQGCEIHDTQGTGIVFAGGARGSLLACHVHANQRWNVEITEGSQPTMRKSTFEGGGKGGIRLRKDSSATFEGCTIVGNASTGVEIGDSAAPRFFDCSVTSNKGYGVLFTGQAKGKLAGSQIGLNRSGNIVIRGSAQPVIQHCRIHAGNGPGILFAGNEAGGLIEHCEITDNKTAGILLQKSGRPTIRACQIQNNAGVALLIKQKGRGLIENWQSGDADQEISIE